MDSLISNILSDVFFDFPSGAQRDRIANYAASIPQRLEILTALQNSEETLVNTVVSELQSSHPENQQKRFWRELPDYLALVLRVCSQAMILDNPEHIDRTLTQKLRVYVAQCRVDPQLMEDALGRLTLELNKQLEASKQELIQPFLIRLSSAFTSPSSMAV